MMFLAPLFHRNHDAHRLRWFVLGAIAGSLVIELAYMRSVPALAADPEQCQKLGRQLGSIVKSATDDIDLQQAVEASAEAHCILLDEAPLTIRLDGDKGVVPATEETDPPQAPIESKRDKWCAAHYASYHPNNGTVLRRGSRTRTACPYPG